MKIFSTFPTINISKLNVCLVICIAKNFIWTTLKAIFSILRYWVRFFCTLRFQIYPYINGKLIYSAFGWCINVNFQKPKLMTGFVVQYHTRVLSFWISLNSIWLCLFTALLMSRSAARLAAVVSPTTIIIQTSNYPAKKNNRSPIETITEIIPLLNEPTIHSLHIVFCQQNKICKCCKGFMKHISSLLHHC